MSDTRPGDTYQRRGYRSQDLTSHLLDFVDFVSNFGRYNFLGKTKWYKKEIKESRSDVPWTGFCVQFWPLQFSQENEVVLEIK